MFQTRILELLRVYLYIIAYHHRKPIPLLSYKLSDMAGSSKNLQRILPESFQRCVLGSALPSSQNPPIRHGEGKSLMMASPREDRLLYGQMREPREKADSESDSEATTSGRINQSEEEDEENSEEITGFDEEQEVDEEVEEVEPPKKKAKGLLLARPPSLQKRKKKELDPVDPRPGHPEDSDFQESARLISKADVRNPGFLESFYLALVPEEHRDEFPREKIHLRAPEPEDRAHDSKKGVTIYWKMPHCGFKLKLSPFVREILKNLEVAPAQLPPAAWSYISSFEEMFTQFSDHFSGLKPTYPVFFRFFRSMCLNSCYSGIRKAVSSPFLFDISRASKWNKFDGWNHAWVYFENPGDFECWRDVRVEWKVLVKEPKKSKKEIIEESILLPPVDQYKIKLVEEFVKS